MGNEDLITIAELFCTDGRVTDIRPVGNGHINDTYRVTARDQETGDSGEYILQRINDHIFSDPGGLMDNITAVTKHIGGRLAVIPARDGGSWCRYAGGCWRMMTYFSGSYTCEKIDDPEQFREIGRAYGAFIEALSDFPAETLHETIEGFHDTRKRFDQLIEAVRKDTEGRKSFAAEEIRFAFEREKDVDILADCAARGEIPLRVTHNDTKINNVLLDRATGKAVCVIDLDTVMPGLAVNDFGDAIRSGASTGREDEPDADSIRLDLELYRSFARGFLEGCPSLTERERELFPVGARMMTLECGIRFLTDYLAGDHYFKTDYPEHNLVRCRTQFRLVRDMEEKWNEMRACIDEITAIHQ
ncbi:MAG: aminoglycoside phosphotransferase family protein [Mogibacterium sp.]|nr:aminoglycoside phosphotransferase family protein [Mogibacterium sp.]